MQLTAADMEKTMFGASYGAFSGARPIFVTSLPRAGTTLMLEALHRFPSLASHVYRDMPFVMAPMMWSRLTSSFYKPSVLKERAHGDGMEVGFDSPEAFEEILWKAFWPQKYTATGIALWDATDGQEEGRAFFSDHMKKIIALRRPLRPSDGRYISKNNGNIARLDIIDTLFPDAQILLVLRRPADHARSLLRQHLNFLQMHRDTPFVRQYMDDIGHYEFGELHRPIMFPGVETLIADRSPLTLDYWLGYWIAAFEYVRSRRQKVFIVSYEAVCADAPRLLAAICDRLGIPEEGILSDVAALFRSEPSLRGGPIDADPELLARAQRLHEELLPS